MASLCPKCGLPIGDDVQAMRYRRSLYHQVCYQQIKAKAQNKNEKLSKEEPERKELSEYLKKLFNSDVIPPLVEKQIRDYQSDGMTYADILLSLRYFYDLCGHEWSGDRKTIGIVPYVIEEAKTFKALSEAANRYNAGIEPKQEEDEVVRIPDISIWHPSYSLKDLEGGVAEWRQEP